MRTSILSAGVLSLLVFCTPLTRTNLFDPKNPDADSQKPLTVAKPAGGSYGQMQSVTLKCNDNFGCRKTIYTVDGSNPGFSKTGTILNGRNYKGPIILEDQSQNTIKFLSIDRLGNIEPVKTEEYNIDSNLPALDVEEMDYDYLSSNGHTRTEIVWTSDRGELIYEIKIGGNNCNSGTVIESGLTLEGKNISIIEVGHLEQGENDVRICVQNYALDYGSYLVNLNRDDNSPELTAATPDDGASLVSVYSPIKINFSKLLDANTLNTSTIIVSSGVAPIAGTVSYDPTTGQATFLPSTALPGYATILVVLTGDITDANGNSLEPGSLSFTTGAPPDNQKPLLTTANGQAGGNTITLTFSEPVYSSDSGSGMLGSSLFSYNDDNTGGGSTVFGMNDEDGSDNVVTLQLNENLILSDGDAAGNEDSISIAADTIYDFSGNVLDAVTLNITVLSGAPPVVTEALTLDLDHNGRIDHYRLTFDTAVQDNTFPGYINTGSSGVPTPDWFVAGHSNVRIDTTPAVDIDNDNIIYLAFDEGSYDTDQTPQLTTSASPGIKDFDPTPMEILSTGSIVEKDGAAPVLYACSEKAGEKNLVCSFSEPVYTETGGNGNLQLADFSYSNVHSGGATALDSFADSSGSDGAVTLVMDTLFVNNDNSNDTISAVSSSIYDLADISAVNLNEQTSIAVNITPGDAPVLEQAETVDIEGDGKIDHYRLTFDVPVDDSTFPGWQGDNAEGTVTGDWAVAGYANVRLDTRDAVGSGGPGDTIADDNVIYIAFDEIGGGCNLNVLTGCDGEATPQLTTTASPGLYDFDPTALPQVNTGTVVEEDRVLPVLKALKANGGQNEIYLYMSEAVTTLGQASLTLAALNYTDNNSSGVSALSSVTDADMSDRIAVLQATGTFSANDDAVDTLEFLSGQTIDENGNLMADLTTNIAVVPAIQKAETLDIDKDGYIDHYRITFYNDVDDTTFPGYGGANTTGATTNQWKVAGYSDIKIDTRTASPPTGPSDIANDNIIYIMFTEGSSFDTDALPQLTTLDWPGIRITGGSQNLVRADDSTVAEEDKAAPLIIAEPYIVINEVTLNFSEPVDTNGGTLTANMVTGDFNYANIGGGGATAISGMADNNGIDELITVILNNNFAPGDSGKDTIKAASNQIFDSAGNAALSVAWTLNGGIMQFSKGQSYSATNCALAYSGQLKCWGEGTAGMIGDSANFDRASAVQVSGVDTGASKVVAGRFHTCAIINGAMKCWGSNSSGQLGNNSTTSSNIPVQVNGLTSGVTDIAVGNTHSCAVHNGAAKCWGYNNNGELGDTTYTERHTPVQVSGLTSNVTSISAFQHTCAVHNGAAKCWGAGTNYKLGTGNTLDQTSPQSVPGMASGVTIINAGSQSTCAIKGGAVYCWGKEWSGELGDGGANQTIVYLQPWANPIASGATDITSGYQHYCALVSGAVKCWGLNADGQLGNNSTSLSVSPVSVNNMGSGVSAIGSGMYYSCAIKNGVGYCWGDDSVYQLGDDTTKADKLIPTQIETIF